MLFSQFVSKILYLDGDMRGTCLGVGVSKKNFAIKYLLCSHGDNARPDFALPISALHSIGIHALTLSRIRPAIPKNVFKILPHKPVYSQDGVYLGVLQDVEFKNGVATKLIVKPDLQISFSCVQAVADAILLRKSLNYPLGQRIPSNNQTLVTKTLLKRAIEQKGLIHLTLSLQPFSMPNTSPTISKSPRRSCASHSTVTRNPSMPQRPAESNVVSTRAPPFLNN